MAYSKVIVNGSTIMDVTQDTVEEDKLKYGYTAHEASGAQITGTSSGGGSVIVVDTPDLHGGTIREITATENFYLQGAKTIEPSTSQQVITPDTGYDGFSSVIVEGTNEDDIALKDVVFIDYDGKIVYNYTAQEFLAMETMPANPTRTGLVAQGWNWTLVDAKEYVEENNMLVIGQNYTTSDGKTRIYLNLNNATKNDSSIMLRLRTSVAQNVLIDWGDGDTQTSANNTNNNNYTHKYTEPGRYVITLMCSDGTYILGNDGGMGLFSTNEDYGYAPTKFCVEKIEVGDNVSMIPRGAMTDLNILSISIPSTLLSITSSNRRDTFNGSYRLKALVIPNNCYVNNQSEYFIDNCRELRFLSLPKSATGISLSDGNLTSLRMLTLPSSDTLMGRIAYNCRNLEKISIPGTYTTMPANITRACPLVTKLTIPANVQSIPTFSVQPMASIKEYHFEPTTPPTLAGSGNMFTVNSNVKIYVPYSADHSVLNAYLTATNWSTFANYIEEEPQS